MALAAAAPSLALAQENKMDRMGLTTVVFRNRFESTSQDLKDKLTLLDIPEYFVDRFRIYNVEFWSRHFESTSKAYLTDLSTKLKESACQLIDIQVDTHHDISDTIEENRQKGIQEMKDWIDVASFLGSKFVRVSQMRKSYDKSVESLRVLLKYAANKRVTLLVENHFDMYSKLENQLNLVKDIRDKNFGLLADFGNYPAESRIESLVYIAPNTKLVSAKTTEFSERMEHLSYNFNQCISIFEDSGYKGIYSLEQWSKLKPEDDPEQFTDWMIEQVLATI